jgi:hypothetical protein
MRDERAYVVRILKLSGTRNHNTYYNSIMLYCTVQRAYVFSVTSVDPGRIQAPTRTSFFIFYFLFFIFVPFFKIWNYTHTHTPSLKPFEILEPETYLDFSHAVCWSILSWHCDAMLLIHIDVTTKHACHLAVNPQKGRLWRALLPYSWLTWHANFRPCMINIIGPYFCWCS